MVIEIKKLFNSYVKGRRRRLQIIEIQTRQGDIINSTQNIREEAVQVYMDQFKETHNSVNYEILSYINMLIIEDLNDRMERMPELEKVK